MTHACTPGAAAYSKNRIIDAEWLVPIMHELGVDITARQRDMLLEDVVKERNSPMPIAINGRPAVTEKEFMLIFKTSYDNKTTHPTDAIKNKLVQIMSKSQNPFIQMLSIDEQRMLIDGSGLDGSPNCRFKTFDDDAVIVHQGDNGQSMFIVVEGQLSVIVAFGNGPSAQKKEVATLTSGAVMGEMSLVLSKPRNATCIVKGGKCDVAEITLGALEKLMTVRPYLQRELQDIALRRDVSNVVTGFSAHTKSLKLTDMLKNREAPGMGPRLCRAATADGAQAGPIGNGGTIIRFPRTSRVLTRNTKTLWPCTLVSKRNDSSAGPRPASVAGGETWPAVTAPLVPMRTGCWMRCQDGYLLTWDMQLDALR